MIKNLYIDTETTGLYEWKHELYQIGAVFEIDGEVVGEFSGFSKPVSMSNVDPEALKVSHRTMNDLHSYGCHREMFRDFLKFLSKFHNIKQKKEKITLVGQNIIAFDVKFIKKFFSLNGYGDKTGLFTNLFVECIWPPADIDSLPLTEYSNFVSLCFKISYEYSHILLTGDIDSTAAGILAGNYSHDLNTDLLVVPHHGSAGSLNAQFYGYCNPSVAIISCGMQNPYNHPSEAVIKFLAMQMQITIFDTRYNGSVCGKTNGEYWAFDAQ